MVCLIYRRLNEMKTYKTKVKGLTGRATDILELLGNAKATDIITLKTLGDMFGDEEAYNAVEQLSRRGLIEIYPDGIELIWL